MYIAGNTIHFTDKLTQDMGLTSMLNEHNPAVLIGHMNRLTTLKKLALLVYTCGGRALGL